MMVQGQHLVDRFFPGNQLLLRQAAPGSSKITFLHGKPGHQRLVAIVAEPSAITDSDKEQIQRRCLVTDMVEIPFTDQAVVDPTELLRDPADKVRVNRLLVDRHTNLLGDSWLRYPAPIVADDERS